MSFSIDVYWNNHWRTNRPQRRLFGIEFQRSTANTNPTFVAGSDHALREERSERQRRIREFAAAAATAGRGEESSEKNYRNSEEEEREQEAKRLRRQRREEILGRMNRGQRYEPLPQRDTQEPIILSPIPINTPSYNYNSGIPTSISSAAPSIISHPDSPPPSFHTHSSPGTPRPSQTQSQLHSAVFGFGPGGAAAALRGGDVRERERERDRGEELWGIAPSTVGGETLDGRGEFGMSADALATIKGLRQRVEWLEESMGRLLLEKEQDPHHSKNKQERTNCCVSFTDVSPDLESRLLSAEATNCCVSFQGSRKNDAKRKEQRLFLIAFLFIVVVVCGTVAIIMTARSGKMNRAVNKAVDKAVKYLE